MCKQIGPDDKYESTAEFIRAVLSAWCDRTLREVSVTVTVWRLGYSLLAIICRYMFGVVWNPLRILSLQLTARQNDSELTTR